MGSGYRNFASAEVLTSSNVMNYLMEQAVMSFASAAARDAAVTSPEEGMFVYLQDVDRYTAYANGAWIENLFAGAWATYTVTWSSSGTQPAIGNGSQTGRYARIGKTILFSANVTMGTTSTYGTGSYSLSLPFAAAAFSVEQLANVRAYDASAGLAYLGQGLIGSGSSTALIQTTNGGSLLSATSAVPFTWATSDQMRAFGMYEAA